MLLLAFWALRNVALAPLIGLPVVARTLTAGEERADDVPARIGWVAAALVAFVALVMGVRAAGEPDFTFAGYPVKAMQYVDTHGLDRFVSFDAQSGTLRCEAGVLLSEILKLVVPRGWFVPGFNFVDDKRNPEWGRAQFAILDSVAAAIS